ncbi:MAG: glycosyl hydrolase family 18 protein [Actinomycetes bacterium]
MRRALVGLLLASTFLASSLVAPSAANAAPARIASGWMPYWVTSPSKPQGVNSAVANADLFTDVSPFWYSALVGGPAGVQVKINPNFGNGAANIAWAMGQLKAAGLSGLPAIAYGTGKGKMAAALADPAKRAVHVADIVNLVMANGFDGIDLDYEVFAFSDGSISWAATQPNWTAFIQELGAALHAQGKQLAVTIPPPCSLAGTCSEKTGYWVYNIAGIAQYTDRMRIMAYDYHYNGIGPIAPIGWVRSLAQYGAAVAGGPKIQIGVPTYGRAWPKTSAAGKYQLTGNCPSAGTSAYNSLTKMASATDAEIPGLLASVGVAPESIVWDAASAESWVEYDKSVQWTDGSGVGQTCTARRVMWWVGPQAVLARTQLVGELGLSAAAYWTIGGEDPSQWPLIRTYATQLAPAATEVTVTAEPRVTFNTPVNIASTITSGGTPLAGLGVTLQFLKNGSTVWANVASAATAADGTVAFAPVVTEFGQWRIYAPGDGGRAEQDSDPVPVEVAAIVTVATPKHKVKVKTKILMRVVAQPARAKQVVMIQIQRGDGWRTVGKDRTNAKGVTKIAVTSLKQPGEYVYRALAQARSDISEGASAPLTITVRK